MSSIIAQPDKDQPDSVPGARKDGLTPKMMGELTAILDEAVAQEETGNIDGAIWCYSVPAPGVRYYGFETPERIGR